jgi:hypothetical protein
MNNADLRCNLLDFAQNMFALTHWNALPSAQKRRVIPPPDASLFWCGRYAAM